MTSNIFGKSLIVGYLGRELLLRDAGFNQLVTFKRLRMHISCRAKSGNMWRCLPLMFIVLLILILGPCLDTFSHKQYYFYANENIFLLIMIN